MTATTNTTTEFSLRTLIRDVADSTPFTDLSFITAEVLCRVPDEHLREALSQALPRLVREVATENRPRGPIARPSDSPPPPAPSAPPAAKAVPVGGPSPQYSGNRKGAEIRDAWQKVLEAPYGTASGQKRLGDCTYDDLQFMATGLDKQAADYAARARGFRELAALLTDHEAPILRELPAEVLMNALGAK